MGYTLPRPPAYSILSIPLSHLLVRLLIVDNMRPTSVSPSGMPMSTPTPSPPPSSTGPWPYPTAPTPCPVCPTTTVTVTSTIPCAVCEGGFTITVLEQCLTLQTNWFELVPITTRTVTEKCE